MNRSVKRKTTDGLIWSGSEKIVSKGLQFLFSILVARILMPEDYGLITIANIFISLSDVLIDSGFSKALLRKKEKTEEDYNTVFYFNILVSFVLYALIFLLSPFIADYYAIPLLESVIKVISLILVLNALCGVQSLHLIAKMDFKRMAFLEASAMITAGIVAIVMAYKGMGVWALVVQTVLGSGIRTLLFWFFVKWTPSFRFSFFVLKRFFAFGSRLLLSDFVGRLYSAFSSFAIGKVYSAAQLGNYGKAESFSSLPVSFISGPISSVTYPAIAEIQDDKEKMKTNLCSMLSLTGFLVFPVLIGIISIASSLVPVVLKSQWNGMIPYLQILVLSCMSTTMLAIPQNYLLVLGHSKIVFRVQVLSKVIGFLLLIILLRVSLIAICLGIATVSLFTLLATLYCLHRIIRFSLKELIKGVAPSLLNAILMGVIIVAVSSTIESLNVSLIVGVLTGILSYFILSVITNNKNYKLTLTLLKPYFKK